MDITNPKPLKKWKFSDNSSKHVEEMTEKELTLVALHCLKQAFKREKYTKSYFQYRANIAKSEKKRKEWLAKLEENYQVMEMYSDFYDRVMFTSKLNNFNMPEDFEGLKAKLAQLNAKSTQKQGKAILSLQGKIA